MLQISPCHLALLCLPCFPWICIPKERDRYQRFLDKYPITKFDACASTNSQYGGRTPALRLPNLIDRFDWIVNFKINAWETERPGVTRLRTPDPRTVLVAPHAVGNLFLLAEDKLAQTPTGRVVVFMGLSWQMTSSFGRDPAICAATVAKLHTYFDTIFYMGRDIDMDGVRTMPTGLSEHYLRQSRPDLEGDWMFGMERIPKPHNILSSFGTSTHLMFSEGIDVSAPNSSDLILQLEGMHPFNMSQTDTDPHMKGQASKLVSRVKAEQC